MKKAPEITEAEIRRALEKFEREGGLITRLPDIKTPCYHIVGSELGMYENPTDPGAAMYGE